MFRLQDMRSHKHLGLVVKLFFGLLIVSFVFFYGWSQSSFEGHRGVKFAKLLNDNPLARLNPFRRWTYIDQNVMTEAKESAVLNKERLLPPEWLQFLQNQRNLDQLVSTRDVARQAADQILTDRVARKMGVQVTSDMVIDLMKRSNLTDEQLRDMAARAGYGNEVMQYIDSLCRNQETREVEELTGLVTHASLFELWQEYSLGHEKLTFEMAAYPTVGYEPDVKVTDKELEDYLAAHREKFRVPDMRRYAYVKLTMQELKDKVQPTDPQIQAYYDGHPAEFREKASTRAEEIFVPLAADAPSTPAVTLLGSFQVQAAANRNWRALADELTRLHPPTKVYYSQTNWLTPDSTERSKVYLDRLATLTDDRVSTPVVDPTRGVYLIRVTDRRKEGVPPLAEIRNKVIEAYKNSIANEQFEAKYTQMRDEVKRSASLRTFAQAVGLRDELTTSVARSDYNIPGVGSFYEDATYISNLGLHELSDIIKRPDMLVALEVIEEVKAHDPTLAEARAQVEKALRGERAVGLAKATAEAKLKAIQGGADFSATLAGAPKPLFTTEPVTRMDTIQNLGAPLINFASQSLSVVQGSTGITPYGYSADNPQGYAVWKVTTLEPADINEFARDRQKFEQDYVQIQRLAVINEWLADLRRQADFTMVEKVDEGE